jgi:hypothetical protein
MGMAYSFVFYLLEVFRKAFENPQTLCLYDYGRFPRLICLEILIKVIL